MKLNNMRNFFLAGFFVLFLMGAGFSVNMSEVISEDEVEIFDSNLGSNIRLNQLDMRVSDHAFKVSEAIDFIEENGFLNDTSELKVLEDSFLNISSEIKNSFELEPEQGLETYLELKGLAIDTTQDFRNILRESLDDNEYDLVSNYISGLNYDDSDIRNRIESMKNTYRAEKMMRLFSDFDINVSEYARRVREGNFSAQELKNQIMENVRTRVRENPDALGVMKRNVNSFKAYERDMSEKAVQRARNKSEEIKNRIESRNQNREKSLEKVRGNPNPRGNSTSNSQKPKSGNGLN